jgi:hypothetical protein
MLLAHSKSSNTVAHGKEGQIALHDIQAVVIVCGLCRTHITQRRKSRNGSCMQCSVHFHCLYASCSSLISLGDRAPIAILLPVPSISHPPSISHFPSAAELLTWSFSLPYFRRPLETAATGAETIGTAFCVFARCYIAPACHGNGSSA